MTRAVCRISTRTGAGKLARPGRAWRTRHARSRPPAWLEDGAAARHRSPAGAAGAHPDGPRPGARSRRRSRGSSRSPSAAASAPMANEPAYHSGLSRLGRAAELAQALSRTRPGDRPLPRAASSSSVAGRRRAGQQRLAVVERLGGDFAGMVDAHQGRRRGGARRRADRGCCRAHPGRGGLSGPARRPSAGRDRRRRWQSLEGDRTPYLRAVL